MLGVLYLVLGFPVAAQPVLPEAENAFDEALLLFEEGAYIEAYEQFRAVHDFVPAHRKTEVALLMAAKALYRSENYALSAELLSQFVEQYPSSRYMASARRTLRYVQQGLANQERDSALVRLGVILPMNWDDRRTTQYLFHGIHLAVEEENSKGGRQIKIIFRDSQHSREGARQAVESLVAEDVHVIVGPLYSEEAMGAAQAAEKAGIVMVAPLATGSDIAQGNRHVFQANPPTGRRGAFMARMAIDRLGLNNLAVVAESSSGLSTRLAENFQGEATRLGANISYVATPVSLQEWLQNPDLEEQLIDVEAIYLPVHTRQDTDTRRLIIQALQRLRQLPVSPHILGGTTWNDPVFSPHVQSLRISFADVFHVNENLSAIRTFKRKYEEVSGIEMPGRLAYVGYDITRFVIQHLEGDANTLQHRLQSSSIYHGLGTRIRFDSGGINQEMFLLTYRYGGVDLVR